MDFKNFVLPPGRLIGPFNCLQVFHFSCFNLLITRPTFGLSISNEKILKWKDLKMKSENTSCQLKSLIILSLPWGWKIPFQVHSKCLSHQAFNGGLEKFPYIANKAWVSILQNSSLLSWKPIEHQIGHGHGYLQYLNYLFINMASFPKTNFLSNRCQLCFEKVQEEGRNWAG